MIFKHYASYYDVFYRKKNYKKECVYLERIFKRFRAAKPKTILDTGCGTGNHLIALARRGFSMTGIDSSSDMLKQATEKCKKNRIRASFQLAHLQKFNLKKKFDCVICMFSVMDYLLKNMDLKDAMRNIRNHMDQKSLFVFDFWNAPAVRQNFKNRKSNIFPIDGKILERHSQTKIFPSQRICEVNYTCILRKGNRVIDRIREKHSVRFFEIDEMTLLLQNAGLKVLDVHPFLKLGGQIRKNTWDVTIVAKK